MPQLFIDLPGFEFEKHSDVRLPAESSKWEEAIFAELNTQHPKMALDGGRLMINAFDESTRSAVGNIVVKEGLQIPIIVEEGKLKPLDMFLKDGKLYPLSAASMSEAVSNPAFGELMPPGQGEIADVFLTHSRPPYDGKYTFAAMLGDAGKYRGVVEDLYNIKLGSFNALPFLTGIMKEAGTKPFTKNLRVKKASIVKSAAVPFTAASVKPVEKTGSYCVQGVNNKPYRGWVFMDPVGSLSKTALFVPFSKHAYDIRRTDDPAPFLGAAESFGRLPVDKLEGHGVFYWETKTGEVRATVPVTIENRIGNGNLLVKTAEGSSVLGTVKILFDSNFSDGAVIGKTFYLPKTASFVRVNQRVLGVKTADKKSGLSETPFLTVFRTIDDRFRIEAADQIKQALGVEDDYTMTRKQAGDVLGLVYEPESVVTVLDSVKARGSVFLRAPEVTKTAGASPEAIAAVILEVTPNIKKHASEALKAFLNISRSPIDFNSRVAKTAAVDQDGVTEGLDASLGLNILTEENILKYVDFLDLLISARDVSLKLLLASRLGLPVDPASARSAAFALDSVVDDLRRLKVVTEAQQYKEN